VTANRVLTKLRREDFVISVAGHLAPSLKGSALAQSTAAKPLRRASAERLVAELVQRARRVNACDDWAYRVKVLVVFGSVVTWAERPNDVDIAYKLSPRWNGQKQAKAEHRRRDLFDGRFRSFVHSRFWPRLEIVRFLKSRSRGLSVQELEEWILRLPNQRIIFQDRRRE
jgi:predicted nucleotidyltransferase